MRPKPTPCRHLHVEKPYTIYKYEYGTLYARIDGSQKHRAYAILRVSDERPEIWRDQEILEKQGL